MASPAFTFTFDNTFGSGRAPNPYSYYLNILSQWSTAPALASMWLVVFNLGSVSALLNDPAANISSLDSDDFLDWDISQETVLELLKPEYQQATQSFMGCVFAQEVTIPGESINIVQEGLDYAGFQTPHIAKSRKKFQNLKVMFLETNASFCDLIIRPWLVLTSHYGLIARDPRSIKNVRCNYMDVLQFAKTGPTSTASIRKIIRYWNVVPTSLSSMTLSQAEEGLKRRDVEFAYDGYSVIESGTSRMARAL